MPCSKSIRRRDSRRLRLLSSTPWTPGSPCLIMLFLFDLSLYRWVDCRIARRNEQTTCWSPRKFNDCIEPVSPPALLRIACLSIFTYTHTPPHTALPAGFVDRAWSKLDMSFCGVVPSLPPCSMVISRWHLWPETPNMWTLLSRWDYQRLAPRRFLHMKVSDKFLL